MDESIFRSYDIRGKYPSQINGKTVFDIGSRMEGVFGKGKIVVGHDARKSSPRLYRSLIGGLETAGLGVIGVGLITTPMLAFFVRRFKAVGGVAVTASHNPKSDNGLGVIDKKGMSIGGREMLKKLKVKNLKFKDKDFKGKTKTVEREKTLALYAKFLEKLFDVKKLVRVVIDCSNGAAGPVIKKLSFPKNVETVLLNTKPDGNFPAHGPDPIMPDAQKQAALAVIKNSADIGVIFDGDGDRALFLDNRGKTVRPEYIWRLLVTQKEHACTVVFSVAETYMMRLLYRMLGESASRYKLVETKVGHLFMRQMCRGQHDTTGIESSMHYYFADDQFAGCGAVAMIKVLNALSRLPYSLSDFVSFLPHSVRAPEANRHFDRDKLPQLYKRIERIFSNRKTRLYRRDGISVCGNGWWFNVRPSNTEDLVRINIEGDKAITVRRIKRRILKLL